MLSIVEYSSGIVEYISDQPERMRCFECLHPYFVGLHLLYYVPSTVHACPASVVEVLPHAFLPQCVMPGLLALLLVHPFGCSSVATVKMSQNTRYC